MVEFQTTPLSNNSIQIDIIGDGPANIELLFVNRGMWLYPLESYEPFEIKPDIEEIVDWCHLKGVKKIYVNVSDNALKSSTWLNWYKILKSEITPDIKLYAMNGTPEWADAGANTSHSNYYLAANWAQYALTPTDITGKRLFDGVMLDVEPHWVASPTQLQMLNWVEMQNQVMNVTHSANNNPQNSEEAEAWFVQQFWLNQHTMNGLGPLDRVLLNSSDGAAILTYRDTVENIEDISEQCLASAEAVGKKIRLTVETDNSGEGSYVDYYGDSRSKMETDINTVHRNLTLHNQNNYLEGVDIHHYQTWKDMES